MSSFTVDPLGAGAHIMDRGAHGDATMQHLRNIANARQPAPVGRLDTWDAVRDYMWAGNATFTLVSMKTGMRYTYRATAKKEDVVLDAARRASSASSVMSPDVDITYFVKLLRGQDNTSDYAYMGVARKPGAFFITHASRVKRDTPSVVALVWFFERLAAERDGVLGTQMEVWHTGRCGRCGRLLTVPESVGRGIGPECAGLMS